MSKAKKKSSGCMLFYTPKKEAAPPSRLTQPHGLASRVPWGSCLSSEKGHVASICSLVEAGYPLIHTLVSGRKSFLSRSLLQL